MRLILLSIVVLLGLACALALEDNANLKDLLGVADQGHAEAGVRAARGYGNYGHGHYGGGHGGYGGHGGHGGGHYGGGHGGHHGGHYGR